LAGKGLYGQVSLLVEEKKGAEAPAVHVVAIKNLLKLYR